MFKELLFFPITAALFLALLVAGALVFIFWIWMLVDCVKRDFKDNIEKIVWVLVIIFTNWIGALIYYFVVKNKHNKKIRRRHSRR